jgi:predicted DNA-binding transcriptional regulator AlpA
MVTTRADLLRRTGVPHSTGDAWYRDRDRNGHPPPVAAVGRRLYFDEALLLSWVRTQLHPGPPPDRVVRNGRSLVSRAELARLSGLSESVLADLYARRATTRHPAAVHRDRRHLYFDETESLAWCSARVAPRAAATRAPAPRARPAT